MHHIMVDLETLDTAQSAVVLSIGLVAFDPMSREIGEKLYIELTDTTEDQQTIGRTVSASTFKWWMQQGVLARRVFADVPQEGVYRPKSLPEALNSVCAFFERNGAGKMQLWGNGADFDNVILGSLFDSFGYAKPWSYSRNRCFRTMKRLSGIMGDLRIQTPDFEGTPHNALDDAVHQAVHLQEIFACLVQQSSASPEKPEVVKIPPPTLSSPL